MNAISAKRATNITSLLFKFSSHYFDSSILFLLICVQMIVVIIKHFGMKEIYKNLVTWTVIVFSLQVCADTITTTGVDNFIRLYSPLNLLWVLYFSLSITLVGIVHFHWLYKSYWLSRKYISYIILCVGMIVTGLIIVYATTIQYYIRQQRDIYELLRVAWMTTVQGTTVYYIPFAIIYWAIQKMSSDRKRRNELEDIKKKAGIILLRNKLESHFLFNTLNTIYATAQNEKATKTVEAIDKLAVDLRDKLRPENDTLINESKLPVEVSNGNSLLKQFLLVWVGLNAFFLAESLVNFLWYARWDSEPIRMWVYIPAISAVVSFTVVSHYKWLYKPFLIKKLYGRYFFWLPIFALAMIAFDAAVTMFFNKFQILGSEEPLSVCIQVAIWRVLVADAICAWVYSVVGHYRVLNAQKNDVEQNVTEKIRQLQMGKTDSEAMLESLSGLHESVKIENAPKTSFAVNELISLFQFSAKWANKETVPVFEELQFIEEYLNLQKMRIQQGNDVIIHSSIFWDKEQANIAPMLLLPYIENAFKYGISYEYFSEINIYLNIVNKNIECSITNTDHSSLKKHFSPGLGLSVAEKRLQLQYEGKYTLETKKEDGVYVVNLRIDLHR